MKILDAGLKILIPISIVIAISTVTIAGVGIHVSQQIQDAERQKDSDVQRISNATSVAVSRADSAMAIAETESTRIGSLERILADQKKAWVVQNKFNEAYTENYAALLKRYRALVREQEKHAHP